MFNRTVTLFLILAGPGFAQVVSYEGTAFPEDTGDAWIRSEQVYYSDRWLEGGWFVQYADIADPGPPEEGEQDFYRRELDDLPGVPMFFLEWRMLTDGPEAFWAVAPASIVLLS